MNKKQNNVTEELDSIILSVIKGIERVQRQYYISYYKNGRVVIYLWTLKKASVLYFKDTKNIMTDVSDDIPKGLTEGFNRKIIISVNEDIKKAKDAIKSYSAAYLND